MVHHNFKKGQKVYCILNDGSVIVDKYKQTLGHYLVLENHKIKWENLRSSTIYKNGETIYKNISKNT